MKAINSIRVPYQVAEDVSMFRELLDILRERGDTVRQITIFMAVSHPPMPLATARHQAEILSERMQTAREYGFESGINILSTLGHHEENLDNSLNEGYTGMTNIEGQACRGSFCPNDERMRGHIETLYRMIVDAGPDYIWIDDDVRFGHMPVGNGCFCDTCLDIFGREYGKNFTRETLKAAFAEEESRGKMELKFKWLQHNRLTLERLFALIEKTVRENTERPIPLGFMTGERYYEGYGFGEISDILKGESGREVYWRPGGGAYSDEPLEGFIGKAGEIGRQVSLLPGYVRVIQSEIENFPYHMLKKSPASTALEAAIYMAAGCTGSAFNVISANAGETPKDFLPMFEKLAGMLPFYDLLAETLGRTPPVGVYTGWTKDLWASGADPGYYAKELFQIGLPAAYSPENACVAALSGDSVKSMPASLIEKLLSGGVYMDARALGSLNAMGYGELTGFKVHKYLDKDCIEMFVEHPMNAGTPPGSERNCYQAFFRGDAAVLEATDSGVQILSAMKDYSGNILSECSWGVFENSLGGRICVAGYYPWGYIQSRPKVRQLNTVFRYLSKDTLPSLSGSYCRLYNWTRRTENGLAAVLVNGSLETLKNTVVLLKTESRRCIAYDMECRESECRFVPGQSGGGYSAFEVPEIRPWQMALLVVK